MAKIDPIALKKASKEVFKAHPTATSLIATSDGTFFLPAAKSLAQDHARKKGLKIIEITRDEAEAKKTGTAPVPPTPPVPSTPPTPSEDPTPPAGDPAAETVQALEKLGIAEWTVAEVTKWAESTLEAETLKAALTLVPTKGGKEAIEARLSEIQQ